MADETTPTTRPPSPAGFFSKPPQRPGVTPPLRPAAPPPAIPSPGVGEAAEPHPWTRYFARMTDIILGAPRQSRGAPL